MNEKIKQYVKENEQELYDLLKALCLIPAPSGKEDERAEFCYKWLKGIGAESAYIDEAKNVVFPFKCENSNEISVFVAHTDTKTNSMQKEQEVYVPRNILIPCKFCFFITHC